MNKDSEQKTNNATEGPMRDGYPDSYFKYHTEPATVLDFGLTPDQEERAKELHKKLIIFDGEFEVTWHDQIPDNVLKGGGSGGSFTVGVAGLENFHGLKSDFQVRRSDWWAESTLIKDIGYIGDKVRQHPDNLMPCYTAADYRRAKAEGKVGIMLDVQNTTSFGNNASALSDYYKLGIRRVQLTYNFNIFSGTGCMEPFDGGLSIFGKEVVEQLNDLNMLVDTAHCSSQTVIDAVEASSKPISCSHAGLKSLTPTNPRTQSDEAIQKVADNGGVFGIVSTPGALVGGPNCTVHDFVNSIEAAINIAGVDHVGFGLDHNAAASIEEWFTAPSWNPKSAAAVGVSIWPWSDGHKGMENHTGYPNLTRGLIARGYSDEDIAKIMGGNFLRLIEETIG